MLYPWLDWQRAGLEAWLATARFAASGTPLGSLLDPSHELIARTLAAAAVAPRPVEAAVARDAPFPVDAEEILHTPFLRLVRLRGPAIGRRFVMLAPHSGYATAIISPLLTALVSLGEVVVTDWTDARLVPPAAGPPPGRRAAVHRDQAGLSRPVPSAAPGPDARSGAVDASGAGSIARRCRSRPRQRE